MKVGLIILNILRSKILTEMLFSAEKSVCRSRGDADREFVGARIVTGCDVDIDVWIAVFWFADRPGFSGHLDVAIG